MNSKLRVVSQTSHIMTALFEIEQALKQFERQKLKLNWIGSFYIEIIKFRLDAKLFIRTFELM